MLSMTTYHLRRGRLDLQGTRREPRILVEWEWSRSDSSCVRTDAVLHLAVRLVVGQEYAIQRQRHQRSPEEPTQSRLYGHGRFLRTTIMIMAIMMGLVLLWIWNKALHPLKLGPRSGWIEPQVSCACRDCHESSWTLDSCTRCMYRGVQLVYERSGVPRTSVSQTKMAIR